jgi:hypothetical protein
MSIEPYFSGWGFLVPVIIGGMVFGLAEGAEVIWGHGYSIFQPWPASTGLAAGGWICWVLGKKLDHRDFRYLEGERVGRSIFSSRPRPSGSGSPHALFYIPMHSWGWLAMLAAIPVAISGLPLVRIAQWAHLPFHPAAESVAATPAPRPQASPEAQQAAIRRHPQVAVAGSRFNQAFLDLSYKYQREHPEILRDPNWPSLVADEVARTLPGHP